MQQLMEKKKKKKGKKKKKQTFQLDNTKTSPIDDLLFTILISLSLTIDSRRFIQLLDYFIMFQFIF